MYTQFPISLALFEHQISDQIKSVNFHITKACNYKCRFCFAGFNQLSSHLSKKEYYDIIKLLAEKGTEKITFVGGEPTLVPLLPKLVIFSKSLGLITMIVTNGSKINQDYLDRFKGSLDWIGLSIDSSKEDVNQSLGRGHGDHVSQTKKVTKLSRKNTIKVKINTVINSLNWKEDMRGLLDELDVARWKVFQMLPISGENDKAKDLLITQNQFDYFCELNRRIEMIHENNFAMTSSYVMIDPEGRFFDNTSGSLKHGEKILEVGIHSALKFLNFDIEKFMKRGGVYDW